LEQNNTKIIGFTVSRKRSRNNRHQTDKTVLETIDRCSRSEPGEAVSKGEIGIFMPKAVRKTK